MEAPISIKIFYILDIEAHDDERLRERLEKHLAGLQYRNTISHWHPDLIVAGDNLAQTLMYHLDTAHLILFLLSADFLASEHCRQMAKRALEHAHAGKTYIIPILLRPADYQDTSFLSQKPLPTNRKPITSWSDIEEALTLVATDIRAVVEEITIPSIRVPSRSGVLWSVPYERNLHFVGREAQLSLLRESFLLRENRAFCRPQALSGLGGIGKTQIALEYAYQYQNEYQAIFWIRADAQELMQVDMLAISQLLRIPQTQEQASIIAAVQHWLRDHPHWLLIFDNVDDMAVIQPFLSLQPTGHIVFTTRATAVGKIAQRIDVDRLLTNEGVRFLLQRTNALPLPLSPEQIPVATRQWTEMIVQAVGGLPLALDQAGAFIDEVGCDFEEYYHIFQEKQAYLLSRRGSHVTYSFSVATTWDLSFSKIESAHPAALDFLSLCTFLDPESIPEELFSTAIDTLPPRLVTTTQDVTLFSEVIAALRTYSLIRRNPNRAFAIHRLVQAVLKQRMSPHEQQYWAEYALSIVNHIFPDVVYEKWDLCRRYLPCALACARHIKHYQLHSLDAARLLYKVSSYLYDRAQYNEVESMFLQALAITKDILGPEDAFTATILNQLANVYHVQARYEIAENYFLQALAIRKKVVGQDHLDTAESFNDLGRLYYVRAQYLEAETNYHQALTIRKKLVGSEALMTADSLQHLGVLYHACKRYSEVEIFYEQAVAIQEKHLGPEHPETLNSLECLARLHHTQGKHEDLEVIYQRVLTTRERILGPEHPGTAISITSLAWLYQDQHQYMLAEQMYQQAVAIQKKVLGAQHPDVASSLESLANMYQLQGKDLLAEAGYKEALEIREAKKGLLHPYTKQSFQVLVSFYCEQRRYLHAAHLYKRCVIACQEKLGSEHPYTSEMLSEYHSFLRSYDLDTGE